jgi:hypothetical protein
MPTDQGLEGKADLPAVATSSVPVLPQSGTLESVIVSIERMAKWIQQSGLYPGCKTQAAAFAVLMQAKPKDSSPYSVLEAMCRVLNEYDVINDRLSMKAHAMAANFLAAGGLIKWHEYSRERCSASFVHPTYAPDPGVKVTVTLDEMVGSGEATTWDAKSNGGKGGWVLKANYAQRSHRMLRARCMSEGVDLVMPGIKLGMLTSEEAEDIDSLPRDAVAAIQTPGWSMTASREVREVIPAITRAEAKPVAQGEADRSQINREFAPRTDTGQSLPPSKPRPAPAPAPEEPEPKQPVPQPTPAPKPPPPIPAPPVPPAPSMAEKLAVAEALPNVVKPADEPANYTPQDDPIRPDQMARLRELVKQLGVTQDEWNQKLDEYGVPRPDPPLPGQPRTPRMAGLYVDEAGDLIRELEARLDRPETTFGDEVEGHPDDGHEMGQAVLPGMDVPSAPAGPQPGKSAPPSEPKDVIRGTRESNYSTHRVAGVPETDGLQHCTICGAAEVQLGDYPCPGTSVKDKDPRVALILEGEKLAGELGYTVLQLQTEAGGDLAEMEMPDLERAVARLRWTAQGKPGTDPAKVTPGSFVVPDAVRPEPVKRRPGRPRKNPATT